VIRQSIHGDRDVITIKDHGYVTHVIIVSAGIVIIDSCPSFVLTKELVDPELPEVRRIVYRVGLWLGIGARSVIFRSRRIEVIGLFIRTAPHFRRF
tara:strand:- start:191 stop:478 length:288 start_codon:yes stop_codon:yes gene_type:complete